LLGGLVHPASALADHNQVMHVESHAHYSEDIELVSNIGTLDEARHMHCVVAIDSKLGEVSLGGAHSLKRGFGVSI
jgi:gamma-glutamyl:cysteine ligase YbdK (ATP-grasp superfamily)